MLWTGAASGRRALLARGGREHGHSGLELAEQRGRVAGVAVGDEGLDRLIRATESCPTGRSGGQDAEYDRSQSPYVGRLLLLLGVISILAILGPTRKGANP